MNRRVLIPAGGVLLAIIFLAAAADVSLALDLSKPFKAIGALFGPKEKGPDGVPSKATVHDLKRPLPAKPKTGEKAAAGVPAAVSAAADSATAASGVLDDILLTPEPYYYETLGRRDPFASLIGEEYLAEHPGDDLQAEEIFVKGILWGERDRFALVETNRGENTIVRQGDRIGPFSVTRIEPDAIVVYTSLYGVGKTVRIPMGEGKGNKNARGDG